MQGQPGARHNRRHMGAQLLPCAPGGRYEVAGILHAKVHIVPQQPRVQQLPHVLALVVGCRFMLRIAT